MTASQCTVIGGVLYVGGGETGSVDSNRRIYKYNRVNDEWSALPRCPVEHFGIGQLEGKPVIVGGKHPNASLAREVFQFEEESQQWNGTIIPPMPTPRSRPCVVSCELGIAVCGGQGPVRSVATVEVFKTETRHWHPAHPLPVPCGAMRATVINDTCYLLGGLAPQLERDNALRQCFSAKFTTPNPLEQQEVYLWQSLPDAPEAEAAPAILGGVLLAVGGQATMIHAYSPNTQSWIHIGNLPAVRSGSTATTIGSELFVMGGWVGAYQRYVVENDERSQRVYIGNLYHH